MTCYDQLYQTYITSLFVSILYLMLGKTRSNESVVQSVQQERVDIDEEIHLLKVVYRISNG
ncbi:hypothetical protein SOMG_02063 [Schizosaccharomyces osmophilus]|uniref:Uncharacterized protein n=1 Tax=Schizosaccharomyces osmophilus TaxID=2545709 RepID=A0AAE9W9B4_9SCHI|nr:uncharacterized protein SOMG_02063 [Schizosaccharomyces osmophilus]WBW71710.1 hypothetical protein SOMG_02063 [Schizosaccharomyces osmophilus]